MFYLPSQISNTVRTDVDLLFLFGTVKDIANVQIDKVTGPKGKSCQNYIKKGGASRRCRSRVGHV